MGRPRLLVHGVSPWFLWGITPVSVGYHPERSPLRAAPTRNSPTGRRRFAMLRVNFIPCCEKPQMLNESQQAAGVLDKDLVDQTLVESLVAHQLLDRFGYVLPAVSAVFALPVLKGKVA